MSQIRIKQEAYAVAQAFLGFVILALVLAHPLAGR